MAIFTNQATLSYSGGVVNSNITTGEILEVLSATKTAVAEEYAQGSDVTYAINIVNSGAIAFTGLSVTDDLGAYTVGTATVVPLDYVADSVKYFVNGVLQPAPTVTAGPPLVFSGINVPAEGVVTILYAARACRSCLTKRCGLQALQHLINAIPCADTMLFRQTTSRRPSSMFSR